MDFLDFIYRNWLWFSVPAFFLSLVVLVRSIRGVVRTARKARLVDVPLLEQQEIEFHEQGRVVLCIEGPMFSTRFRKLDYDLDAPHGSPVRGRPSLFRARTSGLTWARMELRYYEIPHPGRYLLKIRGLKGGEPPDDRHRIVFMRPYLARSVAYILCIVLGAGLLVCSVVLFGLGIAMGRPVPLKALLIAAAVPPAIAALLALAAWSQRKL